MITHDDELKAYATYLLDAYVKINNKANDSGIYWELTQFINEGVIKELIFKRTKIETKVKVLNLYKKDIEGFAKDFGLKLKLKEL